MQKNVIIIAKIVKCGHALMKQIIQNIDYLRIMTFLNTVERRLKMEDLKNQIDILIDKSEEAKLKHMLYGLSSDVREDEGQIQAFKLVRLLINTNLKFVN